MQIQKKNEYLNCFFSVVLTLICMLTVGFCLSLVQSTFDAEYIKEHFISSVSSFKPEKAEQLQYMVLTVLFPVLFICFKLILDRFISFSEDTAAKMFKILVPISTVTVLILFCALMLDDNYYLKMLLHTRSLYIAILLICACFAAFMPMVFMYDKLKKHKKLIDIILFLVAAVTAVYTAWLYICYNYSAAGGYQEHHANAYYYPVYKVYSGQTMLVDFKNIYGFYPYFIVPMIKLLGSCNEFNFSLVMAFLMLLGSLCIIYTLFSACKNRFIACAGSIAVIFAAGVIGSTNNECGYYLQYFPHRYLFPAIILAVCCLYLQVKTQKAKRLVDSLAFFVVSIALLWNLDSGLVAFVAWSAFKIYLLLFSYPLTDKKLYKKVGLVVLIAISQAVFAIALLEAITFARTGMFHSVADAVFGQSVFVGAGFNMLPMPFWNPWLLLVSLYAFALVKSTRNLQFMRKANCDLDITYCARYFILSILGMGLFVYYQGRSHLEVFVALFWNALILLCIFADEYFGRMKIRGEGRGERTLYRVKLFAAMALILTFAGFYIFDIFDPRILVALKTKPKESEQYTTMARFYPIAEKIHADTGEVPDMIFEAATMAYSRMGEPMTARIPERCDWFSYEECASVVDYLTTSTNSFLIDKSSYNLILKSNAGQLTKTISEKFVFEGQFDMLLYFKYCVDKKPNSLDELIFFEPGKNCIIKQAEDGKPWAFDNVDCNLVFSNSNNADIRVNIQADIFPSQIGDYSVTVTTSTGEKDEMSFINGNVSYSKELLIKPGITEITFKSDAPRFDSGDGYTRFGLENIKYSILK